MLVGAPMMYVMMQDSVQPHRWLPDAANQQADQRLDTRDEWRYFIAGMATCSRAVLGGRFMDAWHDRGGGAHMRHTDAAAGDTAGVLTACGDPLTAVDDHGRQVV